jgi:hypothetical protein
MAIPLHVFTTIFLVTNLSNGDNSASVARCLTLHKWMLNCTALTRSTEPCRSSYIASERTYRKQHPHHLFHCCVTSPRMRKPRALHGNGSCLQRHLWETVLYATVVSRFISGFEELRCILYAYNREMFHWEYPLMCHLVSVMYVSMQENVVTCCLDRAQHSLVASSTCSASRYNGR